MHRAAADGRDPRVEVERAADELAPGLDVPARRALIGDVLHEITGFGPLTPYFADPDVSEIMCNGPGPVFVERRGALERTPVELDERTLVRVVERVLAPLGLSLDRLHPIVDARTADGARVHAVAPPLAVPGPVVSIRRFRPRRVELTEFGLGPRAVTVLGGLVRDGANVLVTGATNSGKTTLVDTLARHAPPEERMVAIEDTIELRLDREHVVRLEARPANGEGVGGVTIRDLVRAALRMRPDRVVVGEVRGAEAFDLLQALNTGHRGSFATLHASSAADALVRLETLALLAGTGVQPAVVRRQIASGIDVVVHTERARGGERRIVAAGRVGAAPDVALHPIAGLPAP